MYNFDETINFEFQGKNIDKSHIYIMGNEQLGHFPEAFKQFSTSMTVLSEENLTLEAMPEMLKSEANQDHFTDEYTVYAVCYLALEDIIKVISSHLFFIDDLFYKISWVAI